MLLKYARMTRVCIQFKVAAPSPLLEGMFPLPLTDLNTLGSAFGDCTDLKIRAISYSDNYQVLPEEQKVSKIHTVKIDWFINMVGLCGTYIISP